jgi:4-amino-4-deoxy-L-arabinose transferase-like glycosyltransferase
VAWNMWLRGDYLVPWLNGEAYSHKPPLLFWLMNAGWAVFGVNDWWPRLVPSFFALGSALLTMRIARRLWPQDEQTALLAPMILLGSALWMVFTTATMFDMMVAFFTLLGVLGIISVYQQPSRKGWILLGLAIGGGLLAKGPTILLQLLPLPLLVAWWGMNKTPARWYAGVVGAVLLGLVIVLLWAIPAGLHGGETYRKAIFWGQTADRMVNAFAHRRPLWWYLPYLPIMLFPWLLWLPVWRGFNALRRAPADFGVRVCLAWLVPVFVAFCFISGKQIHYLLPIFPPFALLAARGLSSQSLRNRFDVLPAALGGVVAGAVLLYLPQYAATHRVAPWLMSIPSWSGIAMLLAVLAVVLLRTSDIVRESWKMTLFSTLAVMVLYLGVIHAAGPAFDVRGISAHLKTLEDRNIPLAFAGGYHGEFQFLGRLRRTPDPSARQDIAKWFESNPDGRAIVFFNFDHPVGAVKPEYMQWYQGNQIAVVDRNQWAQWLAQQHGTLGPESIIESND